MKSHTPGPWKMVDRAALDYRAPLVTTADGGSLVAIAEGGGPQKAIDAAEARANARLIAAAPELFEALKQIAAGLADTGSTRGKWMTTMRKDEAWAIALNAIAKTKGPQ